ncbi:hypothetical protein HYI12_09440 [Acinetobacter sp. SwsAc3]|nr:hypothetical protein [Acinetobacter sp. SwsAc3]
MLYKGDQENYQTVIADDEDHEAELIADDWSQYGDLPEQSENQHIGQAYSIDSAALVPVEQFDAVAQKLVDTEAEVERLNNIIANGMQENTELRKQIRLKELEDTPADDLKVMLDEKGVQYGARDNKATLVNLVIESDGSE